MSKGIFYQCNILLLCLVGMLFLSAPGYATAKVTNYVVVGAFEFEENAREWTDYAKSFDFEAHYEMNYHRGLYYVYVFNTDDWEKAVGKLHEVWELNKFEDAWIYTGDFGTPYPDAQSPNIAKGVAPENQEGQEEIIISEKKVIPGDSVVDLSPVEPKYDASSEPQSEEEEPASIESDKKEDSVFASERQGVQEFSEQEPPEKVENIPAVEGTKEENEMTVPQMTKEELREEVIVKEEERVTQPGEDGKITLEDFTIFFNLFNAQNSEDVAGEVQVIDAERAKLLQSVKGGEYVSLMDPNNGTGKLSLIVNHFGYRKNQYEINYYEPFADTSSFDIDLIGDIMVYHFPLVRYHKGDIATMFNVYFFKDAAIMRPESKYELHSLLEMMQENPNFEIKIHGHINGKSPGRIVTAGEDHEFFALTEDDKEGFGSAKKLSKERALVIKNYLINNGIESNRMEIKAWGGKRMLYDKHSSQAHKNVRVEIEILED